MSDNEAAEQLQSAREYLKPYLNERPEAYALFRLILGLENTLRIGAINVS